MIGKHINELFQLGIIKYFKKYFLSNRTSKQMVIKNTFWLFLSEGIEKSINFILNIIIARYLGVEGFGKFSFALSFTVLFAFIADFGLKDLTTRETSKHKNDPERLSNYFANAFFLKIFFSAVTFIIIALSLFFIQKPSEDKILVILFSFYILFWFFNLFFQSIIQGFEKMEFIFWVNLVKAVLNFSLVIIFIILKKNVFYIVATQAAVFLITVIINFVISKKFFIKKIKLFNIKDAFQIVKDCWPLALGMVLISIYARIDTIMLSFMKGDRDVGVYSSAYRFLFGFQVLIAVIHDSIFPRFASFFHNNDFDNYRKLLIKVLKYSVIVFIPILTIASIFSRPIIWLIFGPEYTDGWLAMIILIWSGFIVHVSRFWGTSLIIMNKQKLRALAFAAGAVINIVLNMFLIIPFGFLGAAIATLITEFVVLLMQYFFSFSEIRLLKLIKK